MLGLVLLLITLRKFIFTRTQLTANKDFENNICLTISVEKSEN